MKYAHFLITRFNLPLAWTKDKNNVSTLTEEWLEHRYELFMRYCLPSVVSQTSKDFIWVLLFHDKTPEKYRRKNEELEKEYPFCRFCYLDDEQANSLTGYLDGLVKDNIRTDTEYVITTRLDNDDSIAVDFIKEIARVAKMNESKECYAINPLHGLQYFADYNMSMSVNYPKSHFSSIVEPVSESYRTAYGYNHNRLKHSCEVYQTAKGKVMWMEVCHATNVSNDARLRWALRPMRKGFDGKVFAISPLTTAGCSTLYFRLLVIIPRAMKISLKRLKKKVKSKT